jgi:hypothetical protein
LVLARGSGRINPCRTKRLFDVRVYGARHRDDSTWLWVGWDAKSVARVLHAGDDLSPSTLTDPGTPGSLATSKPEAASCLLKEQAKRCQISGHVLRLPQTSQKFATMNMNEMVAQT